ESVDVPEHVKKLGEWRQKMPTSPTPLIVMAKAQIGYAFEARGTGLANTVSEENAKLFASRMVEAKKYLEKAIELGVKDGEAFALMINAAKSLSMPREATEDILKEGMKIDPAYTDIYTEMAQYLMPRWHGNPGDIEAFAAEILQKVPGE